MHICHFDSICYIPKTLTSIIYTAKILVIYQVLNFFFLRDNMTFSLLERRDVRGYLGLLLKNMTNVDRFFLLDIKIYNKSSVIERIIWYCIKFRQIKGAK